MRKAAFITLFFLGSLNAASLSSLHVDQPQSHAVQCEPASARPDCHNDLPHEHDATHAGEESLFEYIFQVSREAPVIGLAFFLVPDCVRRVDLVSPALLFSAPVPAYAGLPLSSPVPHAVQSRAPPGSPQV
ncbi:MAG TPA: hypothetical protein PKM44_08830 [Turneriella sp.]|nr:hypothetical protein [Turneriella sp.]HMY12131.1 hypothetical protein [Turneriella sp.]HNL10602.1 hypothetical protein [Turneriella sp.]HNN00518.1 hypothetical protein [Turneriella sp.]